VEAVAPEDNIAAARRNTAAALLEGVHKAAVRKLAARMAAVQKV
jgi:hypothetical protein